MKKQTFTFLIGPSLSGKSMYAKEHPECTVVSSDAKRIALGMTTYTPEANYLIFLKCKQDIISALSKGENVIYDATNLSRRQRKKDIKLIRNICPNVEVNAIVFVTDLSILENRLKTRNPTDINYLPKEDLQRQYERFQANFPSSDEFDNCTFIQHQLPLAEKIKDSISLIERTDIHEKNNSSFSHNSNQPRHDSTGICDRE